MHHKMGDGTDGAKRDDENRNINSQVKLWFKYCK